MCRRQSLEMTLPNHCHHVKIHLIIHSRRASISRTRHWTKKWCHDKLQSAPWKITGQVKTTFTTQMRRTKVKIEKHMLLNVRLNIYKRKRQN